MTEQHPDHVLVYDVAPDQSISEAVLEAVAAAAGARVVAGDDGEGPVLDPLYETIDPDALDALFSRDAPASGQLDGEVAFRYHDRLVRVRRDERVVVEHLERALDEASV